MRQVKCMATGELGSNTEFYKAPNGRYFKNESVYKEWTKKHGKKSVKPKKEGRTPESYRKLYGALSTALGYNVGQPLPRVVMSKIKELDYYSDEVITETVIDCTDDIQWADKNRNFDTEYSRACYVMAIISNHVADTQKRHDIETKRRRDAERHDTVDSLNMYTALRANESNKGIQVPQQNNTAMNLLGDDLWI